MAGTDQRDKDRNYHLLTKTTRLQEGIKSATEFLADQSRATNSKTYPSSRNSLISPSQWNPSRECITAMSVPGGGLPELVELTVACWAGFPVARRLNGWARAILTLAILYWVSAKIFFEGLTVARRTGWRLLLNLLSTSLPSANRKKHGGVDSFRREQALVRAETGI